MPTSPASSTCPTASGRALPIGRCAGGTRGPPGGPGRSTSSTCRRGRSGTAEAVVERRIVRRVTSQPGWPPSCWHGCWMRPQAETAAVRRVNPGGCGIGREHQVRKSQILKDLRALAARCELLLGDVDSDDPNGGADHGGGGGERDLLSEYLVEG